MSSSSSSHHPSPLLFLVHLSLLPLPHPPSSLTLPLCLTQTSPTSSRTHLRDLLLSSLFDLLPSSSSQQPPPKPSHAPSSAQHTAFVNAATTFLMDLRKKGLEGEEGGGGWWWKEVKGSVRKSDFADAFGSRYEEVLLALSCQVVWEELKSKVDSKGALTTVVLPKKAVEMLDQLPDLHDRFNTLIEVCLGAQAYSKDEVVRLERRWSALGERRDLVLANGSLPSAISSVPLERLEGIKQLKKNEWSKLVQQWLDMERISEESRDGFSGDLEVVDPIRSGAGGGNGVRVSGGVGRVEFTNALQRTKSLPAAASLVEEQLESLPFLVESARTRLARAQDSVVDRDTSRKEEASPTESGSSEELSYWTEQARLVASSVPVRSLTSLKEEDRPRNVVAQSPVVPSPLLTLVNLNPPPFSSSQRAETIRSALTQTPSSRLSAPPASTSIPATLPSLPTSPPPPTQPTPLSPALRRTPRKIGRPPAAGFDLRRQALGSARKMKSLGMTPGRKTPGKGGRFDAFSRGTPLRPPSRRFDLQVDDGWEEEEGVSLTLEEMAAAQGSALGGGWDSSFFVA